MDIQSLFDKMQKEFIHTTKYYSVGAFGYLIEIAIFSAMISAMSIHYLVASPLSTTVSIIITYLLHRHWTFRSKHKRVAKQFLVFTAIAIGAIIFNTLLTALFVEKLHFGKVISKTIAVATVSLWNFFLHRNVTFKQID